MWHRLSGQEITDIKATIASDVTKNIDDNQLKFIVGCDSQVHKKFIVYTVSIIMLRVGHGGLVYYENTKVPRSFSQPKKRLIEETYKSVATAMWLDEILIDYALEVEEVHSDLNPDKKYLSSEVVSECMGYIHAMGYKGVLKPEAWAASKVADRKNK